MTFPLALKSSAFSLVLFVSTGCVVTPDPVRSTPPAATRPKGATPSATSPTVVQAPKGEAPSAPGSPAAEPTSSSPDNPPPAVPVDGTVVPESVSVTPSSPLPPPSGGLTLAAEDGSRLPDKTLALTFDDGPGERTLELSQYLRAEGIRSVFFINGVNVPGAEAVLPALVADGHLVGNHTHQHLSLVSLDARSVVAEVEATDRYLADLRQEGPLLLRPPYLDWSDGVRGALQGSPMAKYLGPLGARVGTELTAATAADWSCWETRLTSQQCAERYLLEIDGGTLPGGTATAGARRGVVLLHDPGGNEVGNTVDMVKLLVPVLKSRGYSFVRADAVYTGQDR